MQDLGRTGPANKWEDSMIKITLVTTLAAGSMLVGTAVLAEWPEQPITFIIPYGAGGTSDTGARTWGPFMEECLGQTIVFVNRPGAGGEVGFAELAVAAPDGYTLGALNVPNMPLGVITKDDPAYQIEDFAILGNMYGSIVSINARRGGEIKSLEGLVEMAKGGRNINLGISNVGSDDHTKMLAFMNQAGVQFTFIPMADAASSRNAVIGGHVDVSGNSFTEVVPFQEDLVTLAIASEERVPELPDVPTFRELGYDVVGGSSHLIGGPAGMPQEVVDKLSGCLDQTASNPDFLTAAAERALIMQPMNAAEAQGWLNNEVGTLRQLWEATPW